MPFSASTCITYTGTTPLGDTISIFSDLDLSTPITTVPLSAITANNCPYVITNIPDGTTVLTLKDSDSSCCIDATVQSNDLCITCNIDFNLYDTTTASQIIAGNLTGSCDNITDYVVYWYGPDSSTNVGYISGYGSEFNYQFEHPLTGTSAIFAQAGNYTPIVDKVIISGYTFSQTGGTGLYEANLDCFGPVLVEALRCDNGNQPTSAYTHFYSFSGASQGVESPPLQATFELSANTNYFAWKFRGFSIPDTIIFSYSGANYSGPLVVDNTVVGDGLSTSSLVWFNYGKSADTATNLERVICLTGLTRSPGNEYILIDLIPNSGLTNWELSVTCLDFDCYKCIDDYLNQPYKILLSGVTAQTYNSSDELVTDFSASCYTKILYQFSGCPINDYYTTDYYTYFEQDIPTLGNINSNSFGSGNNSPFVIPSENNYFGNQPNEKLFFNGSNCGSSGNITPSIVGRVCATPDNTSTIYYSKYVSGTCPSCVGVVYMEFNQIEDMSHYITTYQTALNSSSIWQYSACTTNDDGSPSGSTFENSGTTGPFSGGTSINSLPSYLDNQDYRYYRYLWLGIPCQTGSTECGQSGEGGNSGCFPSNYTGLQAIAVHPSATVTTGITGSNYYMQIILNTISYGANFSPCAIDCSGNTSSGGFKYIIDVVNNNSTGSTTNFSSVTNTGSYYTNPWSQRQIQYMDCETLTGRTHSGTFRYNDWSNYTLPFSSSTGPMYSVSAQTCTPYGTKRTNDTQQTLFSCQTRLLNSGSTDFEIWCYTLSNGETDTLTLALRYSGGSFTYTDSNFVIT